MRAVGEFLGLAAIALLVMGAIMVRAIRRAPLREDLDEHRLDLGGWRGYEEDYDLGYRPTPEPYPSAIAPSTRGDHP